MFNEYDGTNLRFHEFAGTSEEIGKSHAEQLRDVIKFSSEFYQNYTGTSEADLDGSESYARWRDEQIEFNGRVFPHFIAETEAIAKYAGVNVKRLFDITFQGWTIVRRHPPINKNCSLIGLNTKEGCPAMLSTLDDSKDMWPAIARYKSSDPGRLPFLTTAWAGTAGSGRGMNGAGLWIGTASCGVSAAAGGPLEKQRQYNMGYLMRAMLETCRTVEDVIEFCKEYPFCCNMLIGDAKGGLAGIHQTLSGPYMVGKDGCAAMTNAITDDTLIYELTCKGMLCKESLATSRPRTGFLRDFIRLNNGRCSFEEFAAGVSRRDTVNPWSINHDITVYITLAMPAKYPNTMWVCRPSDPVYGGDFIGLKI